jgi:hypothetical protein
MGVGGGGMVERFALELGTRGVTFGRVREGVALERKRPSSSSMGAGGVDLPLMRDDFESGGKCFRKAEVRPNMSSVSIGWVSRSESASKSESVGTNDFLRNGDGVRVWLYFRGREVAMGGGGGGRWWWYMRKEGERSSEMSALVSVRQKECHTHNTDSLSFLFFLTRICHRNILFLRKRATQRPKASKTHVNRFPFLEISHRGNPFNNHSSCDRI